MSSVICTYTFNDKDYLKMAEAHLEKELGESRYGDNGWKSDNYNQITINSDIADLDKAKELCESNKGEYRNY